MLGLVFLAGLPGSAWAQDVSPDRQVLILTRALAYDDGLKARAGADITIAVIAKAGNGASEAMAATMMKAFRVIGSVKIQGLPIKFVQLTFSTGSAFHVAAVSQGIDVLYVCVGLEADLPAVVQVTRKQRTVSIGSREEHVQRGLAMGVFPVEGKPTIVINLPAAKAEGAAFSSDLLRLAKVLK